MDYYLVYHVVTKPRFEATINIVGSVVPPAGSMYFLLRSLGFKNMWYGVKPQDKVDSSNPILPHHKNAKPILITEF